jgi:flavin reductase (DIM6/NTAB) family NADH-FMN oxidoreductase RutF
VRRDCLQRNKSVAIDPTPAPAIDGRDLRATLGLFTTGVTVVAVQHEDNRVHAMTANSVASLSLDPPLLIFCVARHARMVQELRQARAFTINILHEGQKALSTFFADRWPHASPPSFQFVPWEGGARLEDAVGAIGCAVLDWLEGGDHWIVVGRVLALYRSPKARRPLLFFGGTYRHLDLAATPAPDLVEHPIPSPHERPATSGLSPKPAPPSDGLPSMGKREGRPRQRRPRERRCESW